MPLAISTFLRDTSLRFGQYNLDMTKAALNGIKSHKVKGMNTTPFNSYTYKNDNPYKMNDGRGGSEDIPWLI